MIRVTSKVEGIKFSVNIDHIIYIDTHLQTTNGGKLIRESMEEVENMIQSARDMRATIKYQAKKAEELR